MTENDPTLIRAEIKKYFRRHHRLGREFLDWADEHEAAIDALDHFVLEWVAAVLAPIDGSELIKRLQLDFENVDERWAPFLSRLMVHEFPYLQGHIKLDGGPHGGSAADDTATEHEQPDEPERPDEPEQRDERADS